MLRKAGNRRPMERRFDRSRGENAVKAEHPHRPNRPASGSRSQARLRSPRFNLVGPRVQTAPFRVERAHARTARNKRAAKSMKTNDLAKSLISRPNDFNELQPPETKPLVSFGAIFVSFWRFRASRTPEAKRPRRSPPPAPLPRLGGRPGKPSALVETNGRFGARGRRDPGKPGSRVARPLRKTRSACRRPPEKSCAKEQPSS